MKKNDFIHILWVLFMMLCAPILLLIFGIYGLSKMIFSDENDEHLCDE